MKYFFFLVLCLKAITISSQILEISDKSLDVAIFTVNLMNSNYDSSVGSPYINNDFLPAKINNGKVTQFVRFNCTDDQIEVKKGKTKVLLLDLVKNQKVTLTDGSDKIYHIYKYKDKKGKSKVTYLELINDNINYRLYKKERKKFVPKQNAEGYKEATLDEYVPLSAIYFITDFRSKSDQLLEIPDKKKKILSFFKDKRKELERFSKDEKLRFDNSDDLIKIIDFYFSETK